MTTDDGRKGSLDRGLAILEYLAAVREASMAEIADSVNISRSAAYRVMDRLRETDFVVSFENGRWRLGPAAARMAMAAVQSTDVVHAAPDMLRLLVQQTRETVGLGVISGDEMVFVYRERGPQAVGVNAELGARRPLHCTSVGKAYLAALDPAEHRALIRRIQLAPYTSRTITSRAALEAEVEDIRGRGWAVEIGELDEASGCCGAAVLNHTGRPVAAISVAGPVTRMEGSLERIGPIVASTAEAISRRLGYVPPL
ncbi:IclR family transcriptional regulator [Nonomuraea insulae]|uniref:IclR family transcriptional regulator n=1 Tax=Nonomuraea insulae TaxID=1616787 RepID=A0ABW1CYM9_9ACTN